VAHLINYSRKLHSQYPITDAKSTGNLFQSNVMMFYPIVSHIGDTATILFSFFSGYSLPVFIIFHLDIHGAQT